MEKKKNIKVLTCIIIVLIFLILGIIGYVFYDNFLKKDKTIPNYNTTSTTTIKKNENYIIQKTDIFAQASRSYPLHKENSDIEGNIWLNYPEINYSTNSVKKLNQTIRNDIENNIIDIENGKNSFEDNNNELNCDIITIKKNNKTLEFERIDYIDYVVKETDKYISIIKSLNSATDCASGYMGIVNSYVIDKSTREVMTINEIISKYKNYDLLLEKLKEYINNNYDELYMDYLDKNTVITEFDNEIKNKDYLLYFSDENNLIITIKSLDTEGSTNSFVLKDNEWSEYYIT